MTVLVVSGAFVGVGEDFVGFFGLLELSFGRLVVRIAVRVIFHGQTTVGFLQLIIRGTFVNTQDFVVIAF